MSGGLAALIAMAGGFAGGAILAAFMPSPRAARIATLGGATVGCLGGLTAAALVGRKGNQFSGATPADIKELAYFVRVQWAEKHRRKIAIVISGDFHFGLSRMFDQFIGAPALPKGKMSPDVGINRSAAWPVRQGGAP